MGIIIDCVDVSNKFKYLINNEFFVDKSSIINKFNKSMMQCGGDNICITKPRRFGKSLIAAMLVTYYSKSIDSKEIFDNLKVYKEIAPDNSMETEETIPKKVNNEQNDSNENNFIEQKKILIIKFLMKRKDNLP